MYKEALLTILGVSPLTVDKIYKDYVEINTALKTLYGFKIVSNVEMVKHLSQQTVMKLLALVSPRKYDKIVYVIVRRHRVLDGYHNEIYYLSFNKDALGILIENFSERNVKRLKGYEIANLLISNLLIDKSVILNEEEMSLKRTDFYFTKDDEGLIVRERFGKILRNIKADEYNVYVSTGSVGSVQNFDRIFRIDWEGVLYMIIDFNNQEFNIKQKKSQSINYRKVFQEMEDATRQGLKNYVGISLTFITKDDAQDKAVDLFYNLGFTPTKLNYTKEAYVLSPLYMRDTDYTFLLPPDSIGDYLVYTFEKSSFPKVSEIYGKNRNRSYVFYSFFEENNNPHCMVFAPSGAGKSFSMQNMITNILRVDVKKLVEGETQSIRDNVRIRYFDKGFSAEILFKLLQSRGFNVSLFNADTDKITLNPCDIREDSTDEYDFSAYVINTCLEAVDMPPIQGYELIWYKRALREAYLVDDYKSILTKNISYLKGAKAFDDILNKLYSLGYSPMDMIGQIKEEEFKFLKTPLIMDIIRILGSYVHDITLNNEEKEAIASLTSKLSALKDYPQLIYPTQIDLEASKITYLDFEYLSTSRFFVPILLTILKRLTFYDKYYKREDEYAYYVIDEAHNLLRNNYFNLALDILIREARKFRISLIFLTQNFSDISPNIILNADTIMFISPQEEEKRRAYIQSFFNHISKNNTREEDRSSDLENIYYSTPAYTFTVWYSQGVFSLKLDVDEYKIQVFDSYRKTLTTKDGKVIQKSSIRSG